MYPPLGGGKWEGQTYPTPPRGAPTPQTAHAGAKGLGCIRHCVGRRWRVNHIQPPHERPYPQTAQSGLEGLGCIRRCVGRRGRSATSNPPTGRHYPPNGPGMTGETEVFPPLCGEGCRGVDPRAPSPSLHRNFGIGAPVGCRPRSHPIGRSHLREGIRRGVGTFFLLGCASRGSPS